MKEVRMKTYLFGFVGGGWNSIDAKTKRGAIKAARQKYSDSPNLQVDPNSMLVRTSMLYIFMLNQNIEKWVLAQN